VDFPIEDDVEEKYEEALKGDKDDKEVFKYKALIMAAPYKCKEDP
jgi:hypothetical protein